ncbi:MAG: 3D domain-containing protein [Candidatus Nealsonbacteria bacterium]|nr:3D domain-containing protein [Candidatus Nealsonbacteria bacterium]
MIKYNKNLLEVPNDLRLPSILNISAKQEASIFFIVVAIFIAGILLFNVFSQKAQAKLAYGTWEEALNEEKLTMMGKNSLMPVLSPAGPEFSVAREITVVITAYSSTPEQTDDTPFITASGKTTKDGIIANNYLPFGTKIKIPELYGEKVFVVEDRMSWKKGNYHFDIWFPSYQEAKNFGVKRAVIEILEG